MSEERRRNDSRRRDPRREACEELAEKLAYDEGLRTARLLGLASGEGPAAPRRGEPAAGPRAISVWEPRTEDGELVFVRPEPWPLGDHHAARRKLYAAKPAGTRRLAFFGESVAAGYLYAPHWTPAAVLEARLGAGWEVVDLARTNETLAGLVAAVEASLQLDPDVFVLFAGNNWDLLETTEVSPYVPSVAARQRYALALAGGVGRPAEVARRKLRRKADAALDEIARLIGRRKGFFVVPEVSLADWESFQPPPWLPGDATPRWWELFDEAQAALDGERWDEAARLAREMLDLDGGVGGASWRVLARAEEGRGRLDEARRAAEAEVDHGGYATLALLGAPRATSEVRDIVRRAFFEPIELPLVFAEHTGSPYPGRRLFLDYCHMTAEGIDVAMSEVAGSLVEETEPGAVPSEVDALAKLGAAVHSAHRLVAPGKRKGEILEHWLREALAASPEIEAAFLDLAAARAAPCPAVLSAAQARNFDSPYRLTLQHGWRWDFLDAELLLAIERVLGDERVADLLVEHLALGDEGAELSRAPYLWEPLERFYPEVMDFADLDGRGTYRAVMPRSSFCLVHDASSGVALDLVVRLPAIDGWLETRSGDLEVRVNGRGIESEPVDEAWSHLHLRLRKEELRRGLNRLTLVWPALPPAGDAALRGAIRRLEMGREADVHPVFGEVASVFARPLPVPQDPG